jgi:Domain of unknown function (DUF4389)
MVARPASCSSTARRAGPWCSPKAPTARSGSAAATDTTVESQPTETPPRCPCAHRLGDAWSLVVRGQVRLSRVVANDGWMSSGRPFSVQTMTQPVQSDRHRAYPVQLDLNAPLKVARWRVIGNPIMTIPHWIVLCGMLIAAVFVSIIAWFAILFTGNIPRALFNFMAAIYRYQWRVLSFYWFMREPYPAFDFTSSDVDTAPIRQPLRSRIPTGSAADSSL